MFKHLEWKKPNTDIFGVLQIYVKMIDEYYEMMKIILEDRNLSSAYSYNLVRTIHDADKFLSADETYLPYDWSQWQVNKNGLAHIPNAVEEMNSNLEVLEADGELLAESDLGEQLYYYPRDLAYKLQRLIKNYLKHGGFYHTSENQMIGIAEESTVKIIKQFFTYNAGSNRNGTQSN